MSYCDLSLQGVVEFSLCLLFAKLVSYTFLFWLPLYITKAGEESVEFLHTVCLCHHSETRSVTSWCVCVCVSQLT